MWQESSKDPYLMVYYMEYTRERELNFANFSDIYSEFTWCDVSYQVKCTVSMHKAEVGGYIRKRFPLSQVKPLKNIDDHCRCF